jgi:replicative DNA helicase
VDIQVALVDAEEWDRLWDPARAEGSGEPRFPFVLGGEFILDIPDGVPAVWGEGESVAWAEGEALLIVGPAGVGKSTVAQQLALGRAGLRDSVLSLPVNITSYGKVLYIAADRPSQIARSFNRMVSEADRGRLDDTLAIWRGPLPFDLVRFPGELARMCDEAEAHTLVIDSLKDVAIKLSDDEVGAVVNHAIQLCLEAKVEVLAVHHQRKQQQGGSRPKGLADVYGSTWITAGAGSVILLWGEPGDAYVELEHLKQPAGDIGPLRLAHDHKTGTTTLEEGRDLFSFLQATTAGLTVQAAAEFLFGGRPSKSQVEKVRRKLDGYCDQGKARREDGKKGGARGGDPTLYFEVKPGEAVKAPEMFV